jgi:hypothetical protein
MVMDFRSGHEKFMKLFMFGFPQQLSSSNLILAIIKGLTHENLYNLQ